MEIRTTPLTGLGFARFGTVVATDATGRGRLVNQGRAQRIPGIHDLSHHPDAAMPVLDIYRVAPSRLPFVVTCLEQHPLSSQVFAPMAGARFLVVVTAADAAGQPDLGAIVAFVGDATQIVHYRSGVWHAPMIALDAPATMIMLMWEAGDARDCVELADAANHGLQIVE